MAQDVPAQGLALRSTVGADGWVELSLDTVPVPQPRPDQVLVAVEAAPVNPSDLGLMLAGGDAGRAKSAGTPERPAVRLPLPGGALRALAGRAGTPMPTGNEGAGTVVAAGASPAAAALLGKKVAVAGGGMHAQYRVAPAAACLELPPGASAADGASSYVNPMTALCMVETMRLEDHVALVHTAAASSLGQMLQRLCDEEQVKLVNIVRRPEQADLLRAAGAAYACSTAAPDFEDQLTAMLTETGATLAFDATGGGTLASQVLAGMERAASAAAPSPGYSRYGTAVRKQVYIYGSLERGPTVLDRSYGMAWGAGGWLVSNFLAQLGPGDVSRLRDRVAGGLTTTFATSYGARVSLAGLLEPGALAACARQATGAKFLVEPVL